MLQILVAGAGKSSSWLIDYLLTNSKRKWRVVVMDTNADLIAEKLAGHPLGEAAVIDVHDEAARQRLVQSSDMVLSVLPPDLHYLLALDCIKFKKHLITSSYVSEQTQALDAAAREAGVMLMCEMGLDPGIDHMSACQLIQGIHRIGGTVKSFKTYCGGLVAAESDDNPWHYKISWNPKNVVLAGNAGAAWLENGKQRKVGYGELFAAGKKIKTTTGTWGWYPNRDSLKYLNLYALPEVQTFLRATLRHPSYLKGWDIAVNVGMTNDADSFDVNDATYSDWVAYLIKENNDAELRAKFQQKTQADNKEMKQFDWLGLFENRRINGAGALSSSAILQGLLEEKWKMRALDKDLVIMQHQIEYERRGTANKMTATLTVKGEDRQHSAMAKTVGLPMAALAKKILLDEMNVRKLVGVHIPTMPEVFVPILKELKKMGVEFEEVWE
ncbi:MAG: saccharopine dehydrogenase C-terminal domain-containing protein [Edaphocola sp.]